MRVAQPQLPTDCLSCQMRRRTILTSDNGSDILSKLSIVSQHLIKRIPNRGSRFSMLRLCAQWYVVAVALTYTFVINLWQAAGVYEHFVCNRLRAVHAAL